MSSEESIIQAFNQEASNHFKQLRFEEGPHEYYVGDHKIKESSSKLYKHFVEEVDFDAKAQIVADREGVTKQEILDKWAYKRDTAARKGTETHLFAEIWDGTKAATTPKEWAVVKFRNDLDANRYIVLKKEMQMYHKAFMFSGTADLILYDTLTRTVIIADYKTNEDLYKNFKGKTMLAPFENLLDMPLSHYKIQLNLYQIMIEQLLNYIVSERWIVWLLADGSYVTIKAENLTKKLLAWFNSTYIYSQYQT